MEGVTAAVLAVQNSYYEDIFDLAAAYAVYVVMGHVFGDGNKRTGSGAALVFLDANGVALKIAPRDLVDTMIELQRRAETTPPPPTSDLVSWLGGRLRHAAAP